MDFDGEYMKDLQLIVSFILHQYIFAFQILIFIQYKGESIRDRQLSLDQIKTLAVNRKKSSLPSSTMDTVASGSALFTSVGTADIPQYPPSIAGKNNPYGWLIYICI